MNDEMKQAIKAVRKRWPYAASIQADPFYDHKENGAQPMFARTKEAAELYQRSKGLQAEDVTEEAMRAAMLAAGMDVDLQMKMCKAFGSAVMVGDRMLRIRKE